MINGRNYFLLTVSWYPHFQSVFLSVCLSVFPTLYPYFLIFFNFFAKCGCLSLFIYCLFFAYLCICMSLYQSTQSFNTSNLASNFFSVSVYMSVSLFLPLYFGLSIHPSTFFSSSPPRFIAARVISFSLELWLRILFCISELLEILFSSLSFLFLPFSLQSFSFFLYFSYFLFFRFYSLLFFPYFFIFFFLLLRFLHFSLKRVHYGPDQPRIQT